MQFNGNNDVSHSEAVSSFSVGDASRRHAATAIPMHDLFVVYASDQSKAHRQWMEGIEVISDGAHK